MPPDDHHLDESLGPRRVALEERRKKSRFRRSLGGVALGVVVVIVAVAIGGGGNGGVPTSDSTRANPSAEGAEDRVTTTLLIGTREQSGNVGSLVWLALLSENPDVERGSVIYVPAHTAVEVPGRGLQGLENALSSGGVPLLLVSVENLLGIKVDRFVELSESDAQVLFSSMGSITVDVPSEVRVGAGGGTARIIFEAGLQELSPEFVVQLLYTVGIDGDDEELGARHLAFWDALFDTFSEEPELLERAVRQSEGAISESDASIEDHAEFFGRLGGLDPSDRSIAILPVNQVSVGGDELYGADEDELVAFIEDTIGPHVGPGGEVRVQILNGNGVPGIGQEVANKLVGQGFRVILSGNARRLNYQTTLIVTYDSSDEGLDIANQARDLLGVGEVQVAAQEQGIVDLTIVVGRDFVEGN